MIIKQEKEFKPLTITLETEKEYNAFVTIIDEVNTKTRKTFMEDAGDELAVELSDFFSNNI